jgi:tetratricopeptide (TPR) repeat protein
MAAQIDRTADQAPALFPGQLLAGRYRIEGFLGQGAMGEVYEAEDLELGGRIAVKILSRGIAGDERVLRRFKQEIQLARRVTHPNVCRIYDLVYHTEPPGAEAQAFLTMELLRGRTLEDRLAQRGRMTVAEALPLVRQIAAALGAAHAAGVVHRDLKSANVFLEDSPAGTRAVVNDFGLAWGFGQAGSSPTLTADGELVGSPAYMAPEQVRGETATPATDVYALGVVLYEMVTGELPFVGKSAFYTALKKLQELPPSPRRRVANLDPAWEAVILRCLEREPADRFAGVEEVMAALAGEALQPRPLWQLPEVAPRTAWIGGGACFLFAAAGLFALLAPQARVAHPPTVRAALLPEAEAEMAPAPAAAIAGPVVPRPSVAVLGFENLSGDPRFAYLGTALFQMLPTELAVSEELRLVPVENVDRARLDLGLTGSNSLSQETLARLRNRLGADLVITGSYLVTAGHSLRIDVAVQDTRTGETRAAFSVPGAEDAFLNSLALLGEGLRTRMGVARLTTSEERAVRAARPATLESARLYSEGLAKLRLYEASHARDLLLRAVAAEPGNPLFHSALASAWWDLGYSEQGRLEAKRAFELSSGLRREDRRWIEARYHELGEEWEPAIQIYQELAGYFPDNLEYGLRLARVQIFIGRSNDAIATLAALHLLPSPLGTDPRIDLAEADAVSVGAHYESQLKAAERAASKGEALGAHLVVAEARIQAGLALLRLGDAPAAGERFRDAEALFQGAGNLRGVATTLRLRGFALGEQSDMTGAKKLYAQAIELQRRLSRDWGADMMVLHEIGRLYLLRGEPERTLETLQQAVVQHCGPRSSCPGLAAVLNDIGRARSLRGDLAGSRAAHERARALSRAAHNEAEEARSLLGLGYAITELGDPRDAQAPLQAALEIFKRRGSRSCQTVVLSAMANARASAGDYTGALHTYEEARAIRLQLGERLVATQSLLTIAELALEHNDLAEAARSAREAARAFRDLNLPHSAERADAVLARCQTTRSAALSF